MATEPYECSLSPELEKMAAKELGEKKKHRSKDIQCLRDMVLNNKALTCPTDDFYLLKFLRASKFDYDKSYERLINYHTVRAKNWDIYMTMLPSMMSEGPLKDGVVITLPSKDKQGRPIMLLRAAKWNYSQYSAFEIHKSFIMNWEMLIEDEANTVTGFVWISDFGNASAGMMVHMDTREAKMSTAMLQDAFPIRFKAMYNVNSPLVFDLVFKFISPFLKAKTKERIKIIKDQESLFKLIDKSALPEDYGGTLPHSDILAEEFRQKLLSREEKFKTLQKHKLELDRTIGDKQDVDIVSSVVGTFRKLDV